MNKLSLKIVSVSGLALALINLAYGDVGTSGTGGSKKSVPTKSVANPIGSTTFEIGGGGTGKPKTKATTSAASKAPGSSTDDVGTSGTGKK